MIKKTKTYHHILLLIGFACLLSKAQQDPQYTQYMFNMNLINPAYVGSTNYLTISALHRSQWVGLDGAPRTYTFSAHKPLNTSLGLGLSLISDAIGPVNETNSYLDFSYTLFLDNGNNLAFGVKTGFTFHDISIREGQIFIIDSGDPFFSKSISNTAFNFGTGVYLYKYNRYYVSLSMPNILESVHLDVQGNKIGSEAQHLFLAGGYVYKISKNAVIKPHGFIKYALNSPISFDVNANVFLYNVLELGVSYRYEDAVSAMVNFNVTPQLKIGYAYDHIRSELNIVSSASHEIYISIDIPFQTKILSPRYF